MSPAGQQNTPALLEALDSVRRKAKALGIIRGLGIVVASAVGLLLALVVLDYLLNLPPIPRMILLVGVLVVLGRLFWKWIARPARSHLSINDMAGHLENVFPQFEDRLRSTVDFVRGDLPGSPVMKERTIRQANELAAGVDLDAALVKKPVMSAIGAALAAIAIVAILAFAFKDLTRIALNHLLGGHERWPQRVQIDMLGKVPGKVAAGQTIPIRMRLSKGDKAGMKAIVYYKFDDGVEQQQIMQRNSDGTYSVSIDARAKHNMSVWMKAGDDQTDPQSIVVVPRLAIDRVEARITAPAYAHVQPFTVNLGDAPAVVTLGSTVDLLVSFNKPLSQAPVTLEPVKADVKVPAVQWQHPSSNIVKATFPANETFRFKIHATDTDGFSNTGVEEFEVTVRPDQMPTVMIENPRGPEERTAEAMVRLEALAEDDFDITTMTLMVDRVGDKKHWELPLAGWTPVSAGGERKRFREEYAWELAHDLKDAKLKAGDVLEYYLAVTDNFDLNGKKHEPATSGKLRLTIISQETLTEIVTAQLRQVAANIQQAQNSQKTTKQETTNLRQDTEKKPKLDGADRTALARLAEQQSTLTSRTKQIASQVSDIERKLQENRSTNKELSEISKEVKNTLNQAADNPMKEATDKLNQAQQQAEMQSGKPNDPKNQQQTGQRNQAMQQSEQQQQNASDQLAKALDKMSNLGTFENMIQKVRDALKKQEDLSNQLNKQSRETLGKKPEDLTSEQKKNLENLANEQKKAAENTEKLTQDLEKAGQQQQKSDPAAAQAMKQASQQSKQQQVSQSQQQASQQAQQNQMANAANKQKQAELGLQMMLDTMREAEKRKLEQLARELAKLQDLVVELIRRQAGHNIDNLRIQGTPVAKKLITDDLLAKAERLADQQGAVPTADQLKNFQATTERKTRDYSKNAEDVAKGGAEIAAMLVKAAGFMEHAAVVIKENRLPEAFDPSQVKALASLEDALKKINDALKQTQENLDQANRETIRQAYEKIRDEQKKLNEQTTQIDAAHRPDGSLPRVDQVNLGKLPGQQGQLADRTRKLEEGLSEAGGIVYVWANKDIVDSMNEVKADLAKPTTAKPTQAEQTRIVEQLDSMIKELTLPPRPKSPFKQPPGGGQGQQAGKQPPKQRLPGEAELRLLRDLQQAINKSTKTISDLPNPDKPKLVALGNRQGELRNLLDQLLQKATEGKVKLDKEPDPNDPKSKLPEEATAGQVEDNELDDWLKNGKTGDDQMTDDIKAVGQRMSRSKQRLALNNDPGKTTQLIQEKIVVNIDNLIKMAQQQQAMAQQQQQRPGQQGQRPQQGNQQGQQQADQQQQNQQQQGQQGQNPAGQERLTQADENKAGGGDIREKNAEWGSLTPRERQAVIEGMKDKTIQKYKKITDDYYEAMSKLGTKAPEAK